MGIMSPAKRNFTAWKMQLSNEVKAIRKASSSLRTAPPPKTVGFSELLISTKDSRVLITPRRVRARQPPLKRSKSTPAPRPVTRHESFRRRNFRAWKRQGLKEEEIRSTVISPCTSLDILPEREPEIKMETKHEK